MSRSRDLSDTVQDFLVGCAKVVMYLGAAATLIATGLLVFTVYKVNADGGSVNAGQIAEAARNVDVFQKVLVAGLMGLGVGVTYMLWGSEFLAIGELALGGALYFSPLYLPSILGSGTANDVTQKAYASLQSGGMTIGVIGIMVLIADVFMRITQRSKQGAKADQLKYGKGIKEESDKQNVMLGKCWQLPFCRKFVREKCPIYHAKTTCWKEQVGCMCEEQVIRGAMENKPIPKDALLAASMIPRNNKLTVAQKKDRCYNCIIYNEHLRHQYKIIMPATVLGFLALYGLGHSALYDMMYNLIMKINGIVDKGTLHSAGTSKPPQFFVEAMLFVVFIIGLTYAMKMIEIFFFKKKL